MIQILTFEYQVAKIFVEKQLFIIKLLSTKDKIIQEKEEEIKQLKESLKLKVDQNDKMEQNEILQSQFEKINEFIYGKLKGPFCNQKLRIIKNNIDKYKGIINDLIDYNKNIKITEMQSYLDKVSCEMTNLKL